MLALIYNGQCVGVQLPAAVDSEDQPMRPGGERQLGHLAHQTGQLGNGARRPRAGVLEAGRDNPRRHAQRRLPRPRLGLQHWRGDFGELGCRVLDLDGVAGGDLGFDRRHPAGCFGLSREHAAAAARPHAN